jgi:predicted nucleic acid-binding protein
MGPIMLIDSDILIDFARNEIKAVEFLEEALRKDVTKISAVSHMELIVGCRNKRELNALDGFVGRFEIIHLSSDISTQATDLLRRYRSSHGLMIPDALIAATALQETEPLATRNHRHFVFIEDLKLVDY